MKFIITVRLRKKLDRKSQDKLYGRCPLTGFNFRCSDIEGEHHSYLLEAGSFEDALKIALSKHRHITRVEEVEIS